MSALTAAVMQPANLEVWSEHLSALLLALLCSLTEGSCQQQLLQHQTDAQQPDPQLPGVACTSSSGTHRQESQQRPGSVALPDQTFDRRLTAAVQHWVICWGHLQAAAGAALQHLRLQQTAGGRGGQISALTAGEGAGAALGGQADVAKWLTVYCDLQGHVTAALAGPWSQLSVCSEGARWQEQLLQMLRERVLDPALTLLASSKALHASLGALDLSGGAAVGAAQLSAGRRGSIGAAGRDSWGSGDGAAATTGAASNPSSPLRQLCSQWAQMLVAAPQVAVTKVWMDGVERLVAKAGGFNVGPSYTFELALLTFMIFMPLSCYLFQHGHPGLHHPQAPTPPAPCCPRHQHRWPPSPPPPAPRLCSLRPAVAHPSTHVR